MINPSSASALLYILYRMYQVAHLPLITTRMSPAALLLQEISEVAIFNLDSICWDSIIKAYIFFLIRKLFYLGPWGDLKFPYFFGAFHHLVSLIKRCCPISHIIKDKAMISGLLK
jgi:hypothetical protein